jgi:hypothetical protein
MQLLLVYGKYPLSQPARRGSTMETIVFPFLMQGKKYFGSPTSLSASANEELLPWKKLF